ncbi:MAG: exopolysaccharide biosynthesis polyprenyl glycosylphosphotransferase [Bacteroidota bacterium]|jgi:undecaprenyl-phosphate galactose phosphotransferase|nr:exopolysaccharide biosynthesis polyprenyl glycosylphosphotransferase [Ignavibacteria bacterium]MCU7498031.1 exopolysaccharide biosynthesis polyprenyl glycosylphosphotransferase [Ignavibacteria bacterium]MCU7512145.1 exopolysaccharide biosynthesis polyprenyl glycosylphosphotransferase [Ignavibacteria bacterium]MCU7520450.1 exopolysaccharide biosynthesis polyprenyl glycosylphosphotransferase [Ignavibacteria bacterium]MCU7523869.1 exopolysaccharide biosynthesis polyprenyl glycosylphosphotransfe
MLFFVLAYIGGLFVPVLVLSVITVIAISPVLMKFNASSYKFSSKKRNILIIGEGQSGLHLEEEVIKQNDSSLHVAGFITKEGRARENKKILGSMDQLEYILDAYEIKEVIIAEDNGDLDFIFDTAERCRKAGASVRASSKKLEIIEKKIKLKKYCGHYYIDLSRYSDGNVTLLLKRILDVIVASAALMALLPLMLMIALLVKVTSPGTILFRQLRVGRNGRQFKMYKFRTMYSLGREDEHRKEMMLGFMKNNKSTGGDTKIVDESRVTKIGKILRKTSLDELPQLINVLKGEMSLVGPRPCVPYEFENYEKWQKRRVCVLPGCTGVWQVSGRSSVSFNDSVILDLYYVHNMSVLLDIILLFKTIPVLLFSKGGR